MTDVGAQELISLTVAGQAFCIDVHSVREIRGWTAATPLPQAPEFVLGVINLRGTVMPILDLSARLGLGVTEITGRHVIVVVEDADILVGLVVDAVRENIMIDASHLQPAPRFEGYGAAFVDSLLPRGGEILARLNVTTLLPEDVVALAA